MIITEKVARKMVKSGESNFYEYEKMEDSAAPILAKHKSEYLYLDSITDLSDAAARSLMAFEGYISVARLTTLPLDVAKLAVMKANGMLRLDNLKRGGDCLGGAQGSIGFGGVRGIIRRSR